MCFSTHPLPPNKNATRFRPHPGLMLQCDRQIFHQEEESHLIPDHLYKDLDYCNNMQKCCFQGCASLYLQSYPHLWTSRPPDHNTGSEGSTALSRGRRSSPDNRRLIWEVPPKDGNPGMRSRRIPCRHIWTCFLSFYRISILFLRSFSSVTKVISVYPNFWTTSYSFLMKVSSFEYTWTNSQSQTKMIKQHGLSI